MMQMIFNRVEKKFLLTKEIYTAFILELEQYMVLDQYGKYTICNLYYDTDNDTLIRHSIEKPLYKEKLRLRSYGLPSMESNVFLEVKKKFNKNVNKRRMVLPLTSAYACIEHQNISDYHSQIAHEIDYFLSLYQLKPKVYIAYDRIAYTGKEDKQFRVTFDSHIRSRDYDLALEKGDYGEPVIDSNLYLMEVKIQGAYPIWFVHLLSKWNLYPVSFSKYGTVYQSRLKKERKQYV